MKKHFFLVVLLSVFIQCRKDKDENFDEKKRIDLTPFSAWDYSSVPCRYPESANINELNSNFNRATINWYMIDPMFTYRYELTPPYFTENDFSNPLTRAVTLNEIDSYGDVASKIWVLNITFHPDERGPYNFDSTASSFSSGIDESGKLIKPENRWGGIQRGLMSDYNLFKEIEFWLMDPFILEQSGTSGELYINIGQISEDVLKDGKMSNEMHIGHPGAIKDSSVWGFISMSDINYYARPEKDQDLGLDGLDNSDEQEYFSNYLSFIKRNCNEDLFEKRFEDPCNDNYKYYRGTAYDASLTRIIDRYYRLNGLEGNSTTDESVRYITIISTLPDLEDFNRNEKMETEDNYFEYKVDISKNQFLVGLNYIDAKKTTTVTLSNGTQEDVTWYHFKIPLNSYLEQFGDPNPLIPGHSLRIYLKGFDKEMTLRRAQLSLIKSD